ncbi:hypothetical protein D8S82_22600 [Mycobacterium hodleri]|uniref:NAD(P)/FAD-dependent oxidoreductase n=1 Tax=Mycolicibacterium hodleri TaxID=49897 RepID=A0A544VWH1_9MYCO|nr:hypothetical protein [Mycolicibacterium hodleri]TQR84333.1 hypothetical protein D8S82_22600 [Mycolicibacterium hodleri]
MSEIFEIIETDYLVIGAGATALAFVDTMLDETDASFVIVDRYDQPGGHWRKAYDFVRLHQPADFYGVNSRSLGSSDVETHGLNAGMLGLSSRDEVRAYFEAVVRERFIPSGRVQYLPKTDYDWTSHIARGIVSGKTTQFVVRRKIVDTTYMNVTVPSMRPPHYQVDPGVRVVAPNALSSLAGDDEHYVVVGGRQDRDRLHSVAVGARSRPRPDHVGSAQRFLAVQPRVGPARSTLRRGRRSLRQRLRRRLDAG